MVRPGFAAHCWQQKVVNSNTSSLLFSIAYYLNLPSILRRILKTFANNPPIVLFCHRILPPKSRFSRIDEFYHRLGHPTVDEFESQLRYLAGHHSVVSIEDVFDYITYARELPSNPVSITFDDGYSDNYSLAFPVLQDYQWRATFFLTTDFIGTGRIPFHDQIIYGLCYTGKKMVRLDVDHGNTCEYPLSTLNDRVRSFLAIQDLFKSLPYRGRPILVKKILELLEIEIDERFSREFMLKWEEIETMYSSGYSFYSHTRTHPILTKLNSRELENEIIESNRVIVDRLSNEERFFCYPYGKRGEFNGEIIRFLKDKGFRGACSAIHGINRQGGDRYNIKRTAMISEPIEKFSLRASGLFEILKEVQSTWKRA